MIKSIIALFCITFSVFAEDFPTNKNIQSINKELKKIENLTVKFRQTYGEEMDTGTIFFKKNQGLFIKYNNAPISVLATKNTVTYYDSKLDQKSQIPTKDSASSIFFENLAINESKFNILEIKEIDGAISITANLKKKENEGTFVMYFSNEDFLLRRIDIKSPEDDTVRIDLYSHSNAKISNERFKAVNIGKAEI